MPITEKSGRVRRHMAARLILLTGSFLLLGSGPLFADSRWVHVAADVLIETLIDTFTGPIWGWLSLLAVVVGGLMSTSEEADSKHLVGTILFGIGMAIAAANFLGPYVW
jgi:hypothetical protein